MRAVLAALLLAACAPLAWAANQWGNPTPWNVADDIIICDKSARPARSPAQFWPVFFVSSTDAALMAKYPPDVWHTIDLTDYIPLPEIKSVRLDGLLVITHGSQVETADLHVSFRRHGESFDYTYVFQTMETLQGGYWPGTTWWDEHGNPVTGLSIAPGGQRSTAGAFVPVSADRKIDVKWHAPSPRQHPPYSAYIVNLRWTEACF
jgi:hypothetical protein